MHAATKAILDLDTTPHPNEDAIASVVCSAKGVDSGTVEDARAAGFSWPAIIALLVQYGPQAMAILQALIAALKLTPPTTQASAASKPRRRKTTDNGTADEVEPQPAQE